MGKRKNGKDIKKNAKRFTYDESKSSTRDMILKHRRLLRISLFAILSVFLAEVIPHENKGVFFWSFLFLSLFFFVLSFRKRAMLALFLSCILAACAFFSSYQISCKRELADTMAKDGTALCSVTVLSPIGKKAELFTAEGTLAVSNEEKVVSLAVKILSPVSVKAGDVLYGKARFTTVEKGSYDAAQGFFGTISFEECKRVDRRSGPMYALGELRAFLSERLRTAVPEGGTLLTALTLGVREDLPADFSRDMTRIGTTHMLSLSGMHLAVLTAGIAFLLKRLRIGRIVRTLILVFFVVFFMLLTGLSSSVMRAGFMFLLSAIPLFLREERDGLSSLTAAVAIICLFEPYAVLDLSLWLSALATLGILLFFDRAKREEKAIISPFTRLLRAVFLSLSVTLAATIATLPLTLCVFGTLPLLSPLANLILSPLVQITLYLSLLITLLGSFPVFSWISTHLCNLIFTISDVLADIPHSVLTVKHSPALPFFFVGFAFFLFYFVFSSRKSFRFRVPLFVFICCALTVGVTESAAHLKHRNELTVSYYADTRSETDVILFRYKEERLLTVFSDFSFVGTAERKALDTCADEIDAFLLPYYTDASSYYIKELLRNYKIYRLYLPSPVSVSEWEAYRDILAAASDEGVPTVVFQDDTAFRFEFLTVSSLSPERGGKYPSTVFANFLFGYERIGYYSANALHPALRAETSNDALLVFGAYGAPQGGELSREEYLEENTQIFCASAALFPFSDKTGVVFSDTDTYHLSMRTTTP